MAVRSGAEYAKETEDLPSRCYGTKADQARVAKIVELVGSGNRVLDIGCYDGAVGRLLIEKSNAVAGVEISRTAAKKARENGLDVAVQNIESGLCFKDDSFDVVLAGEIIEHFLDTDFLLDEIRRVLVPSGSLVITTPNAASLGRRIMLLLGRNPYFEASLGFPPNARAGHIRFFTRGLLLDFLMHKGFEIVSTSSDAVNLTTSGEFASRTMARLIPGLGRSIIVKARMVSR